MIPEPQAPHTTLLQQGISTLWTEFSRGRTNDSTQPETEKLEGGCGEVA